MLRSLARVLQLDAPAADHLLGFLAPRLAAVPAAGASEQPPSSVLNLLAVLDLPAFVTGRTFDVLAANDAARAVSPELQPGHNRLRSVFLVAAERALYRDWEATAQRFVALVHDTVGRGAADPAFVRLLEELTTGSARFRQLCERYDVVVRDPEPAEPDHPVAGRLQLHRERLDLPGTAGQSLVVYHPEAGSVDGARLTQLLAPALTRSP